MPQPVPKLVPTPVPVAQLEPKFPLLHLTPTLTCTPTCTLTQERAAERIAAQEAREAREQQARLAALEASSRSVTARSPERSSWWSSLCPPP